jgi:5-bromo-4-chloroindolyl phosphate hydrolysis protein
MNEDYLYNKTGEDAEIENLENLLKDFRLQNTNAPKLPAKVIVFSNKMRRKNFKYVFAVAASLLITFMLGLFVLNIGKKDVWNANLLDNPVPETINNTRKTIDDVQETFSDTRKTINNTRKTINNTRQTINNARKIINDTPEIVLTAQNINKFTLTKQKIVKKVPQISSETFTDEEKFAYEQLKLALSITGSNLKTVKEKIDNADENNSVTDKKVVTK